MKIKWLGHAAFEITSNSGVSIIHDSYNDMVDYKMPNGLKPDIVFSSHEHSDHNNTEIFSNQFDYLNQAGNFEVQGIEGKGVASFHDDALGTERGDNVIFSYKLDELVITHLGDLGHVLDPSQVASLIDTDILLLPCGGGYTIDDMQASFVANQLKPKIVIPMHYRTAALGEFGVKFKEVEDFVSAYGQEVSYKSNIIDVNKDNIDELTSVIIMDYK